MDTQPLHVELKEARERAGLTVQDLYTTTKMSPMVVEAIERGDMGVLPKPYMRLILKVYAQRVSLDPNYVLRRYENLREPVVRGVEGRPKAPEGRPRVPEPKPAAGLTVPPRPRPAGGPFKGIAIAAGLLIVVAAAVGAFHYLRGEKAIEGTERPESTRTLPLSPTPRKGERERGRGGDREPASSSVEAPSLSPLTPGAAPTDIAAGDSLLLQIEGRADTTWVEVRSGGRILLMKLLYRGESHTFKATKGFEVTLGKSRGAALTFRGQPVDLGVFSPSGGARLRLTPQGVEYLSRSQLAPQAPESPPAAGDTIGLSDR